MQRPPKGRTDNSEPVTPDRKRAFTSPPEAALASANAFGWGGEFDLARHAPIPHSTSSPAPAPAMPIGCSTVHSAKLKSSFAVSSTPPFLSFSHVSYKLIHDTPGDSYKKGEIRQSSLPGRQIKPAMSEEKQQTAQEKQQFDVPFPKTPKIHPELHLFSFSPCRQGLGDADVPAPFEVEEHGLDAGVVGIDRKAWVRGAVAASVQPGAGRSEGTVRVKTQPSCASSAKGAKYQWFGTRREGWFPFQAARATEMKRLARPFIARQAMLASPRGGLADFRPDCVTGP